MVKSRSVKWFEEYSDLVFKSYGNRVDKFITFNEPFIELFLFEPRVKNIISKKLNYIDVTEKQYGQSAIESLHLLLANAKAMLTFRAQGYKGKVGIALPLAPILPTSPKNLEDLRAANIHDGIQNRWYLDLLFKGSFDKRFPFGIKWQDTTQIKLKLSMVRSDPNIHAGN